MTPSYNADQNSSVLHLKHCIGINRITTPLHPGMATELQQ